VAGVAGVAAARVSFRNLEQFGLSLPWGCQPMHDGGKPADWGAEKRCRSPNLQA